MTHGKLPLAVALLAILVAVASAGSPALAGPHSSEDIYLIGHDETLPSYGSTSILGAGYRFNWVPQGGKHGWSLGVEYGVGDQKGTTSSPTLSTTTELTASQWDVVVDEDEYYDCCDDDFDCGPSFCYSNTSTTYKYTGYPDTKINGISTYGLGGHFGGSFPITSDLRLFGEYRDILGYTTYDHTTNGVEDKWTHWTFQPDWKGGLRVQFGQH